MNSHSTHRKFTEEFKTEAIRQITERGHKVSVVSERLGVSTNSLYKWLKNYTDGGIPSSDS